MSNPATMLQHLRAGKDDAVILESLQNFKLTNDGVEEVLAEAMELKRDDVAAKLISLLKPEHAPHAMDLDFVELIQNGFPKAALAYAKHCYRDAANNTAAGTLSGCYLHAAVQLLNGTAEMVAELAALGIPVNCTNKDGDSPLHVATRAGNVEACKALCAAGANPLQRNNKGRTPRMQVKIPENTKAFLLDAEEAEKSKQSMKSSSLWDEKIRATQTESAFIIRTI